MTVNAHNPYPVPINRPGSGDFAYDDDTANPEEPTDNPDEITENPDEVTENPDDKCFDKIKDCSMELCEHHPDRAYNQCRKYCGYCYPMPIFVP